MKDRIKAVRKAQVPRMSQEKFAERLMLTRQFVTLLEAGEREPSDRTIRDICSQFGVNEVWLRTGAGDMYGNNRREAEIAEQVKRLFSDRPESFQTALISTLLRFDPDGEEWKVLEAIYDAVASQLKNDHEMLR
ncbi:MAG: helix-turn-helix transcriptional regulator [Oscillospiraceae bacterium]|nr:helix-turn-helix transcriptional regulator [Oscillospiraceae bacterium]